MVAGVVPSNHHERAVLLCRTLLLSGDFFLGGVIAVNLAKLILRLRTLGVGQVLPLCRFRSIAGLSDPATVTHRRKSMQMHGWPAAGCG